MNAGSVVLVALLAIAGTALAASATRQDGECAGYLGDWRAQATPITTGGPPMWAYAGVGLCANVFIETTATGIAFDLRADIVDPQTATYVVKYGSGSTSTFTCGDVAWCEVGPLHGKAGPEKTGCAKVEIWKDGVRVRNAAACV